MDILNIDPTSVTLQPYILGFGFIFLGSRIAVKHWQMRSGDESKGEDTHYFINRTLFKLSVHCKRNKHNTKSPYDSPMVVNP